MVSAVTTIIGSWPSEVIVATSPKAAANVETFGVAVGVEVDGAAVVEAAGDVGAIVGDSAGRLGPGGRAGIDQHEATDAVREHRRERDRLGAAEGVAGEDVRSGLADRSSATRSWVACDVNVCTAVGGSLVPVPRREDEHTRAS